MMLLTKVKENSLRLIYLLLATLTLSLSFFNLLPSVKVSAQNQICNEARLRNLQVSIIDCSGGTSGSGCTISPTEVNLSGSDNQEKAFRFFLGKGLTREQSAGILGNLIQESSVNPEAIQGGGNSKNPHDSGNLGWGLMQWTPGSKILNTAEQANITTPIYELGTQLEIIWWQMNNVSPTGVKNFIENFRTKTTVQEAASDFEHRMEGAGKPMMTRRIRSAQDVLELYGGITSTAQSSSNSSGICAPSGAASVIDGFVVYSQTDPAWKDSAYGSSTIGVSGCGPSAMAMIITTLTGQSVTPVETANYAASKDMYVSGVGSRWTIGSVVASNWGLKADTIGKDVGAITNALREGKLIITPGSGPKPFTSGGHFIVIRGVTENGNWLVGDSGHSDTSDKEWDPQQIVSSMRDGGSYAIYK